MIKLINKSNKSVETVHQNHVFHLIFLQMKRLAVFDFKKNIIFCVKYRKVVSDNI